MSKQGRYIGIYDFLDNTPLDVANGGTGLTTVGTNNILTGNGTGALTSEATFQFALSGDGNSSIIALFSPEDANDGFTIATSTSGITYLITTDAGATAADLVLDIDGDIVLDSHTGNGSLGGIKMKQQDTEFVRFNAHHNASFMYLYEDAGASTDDYLSIEVGAHGATTLTTQDTAATAAHFEIAADGDITLDSAGQIKLEPVTGNNILLDGTIAIDAGVVTGATSITSTEFVGDLTGNADTATLAGWHGSATRIKILPSDFQADDVGRPAMTEDDTTDERFLFSHGTAKLYASVAIPTGYKATHVKIHGSDTGQTHTTYEANIANKDVVEKGAATVIETEKAITNVTSSTTNYLLIEVSSDGATDEIHGGYVTIVAV